MTLERDEGSTGEYEEQDDTVSEQLAISRRELLRKAGWVVPTLVVLPLGDLHAQSGAFGSPAVEEIDTPRSVAPLNPPPLGGDAAGPRRKTKKRRRRGSS